jgi:hypothetical protein
VPEVSATATPKPNTSSTPGTKPAATPTDFAPPAPQATDTPVALGTDPQGDTILVNMDTPATANRGSQATISATVTLPGALCTLTVHYRTGSSGPPELSPQIAATDGHVAWSWPIPTDASTGDWPVSVRCQQGGAPGDTNVPFGFANSLLPIR